MSEFARPMSRRALLRALGLTPLILVAKAPIAATTEEKVRSVLAADLATAENPGKIFAVALRLWTQFEAGAMQAVINDDVPSYAWEASKVPINGNLDKFSDDGFEERTSICAVICGAEARTKAAPGPITTVIYQEAFDFVKDNQAKIFQRWEERYGGGRGKISAYAC